MIHSVDLLSVVVYADFLIIVAVNISLMTYGHLQNTYYQQSDCMQTVQLYKRTCSDSVRHPSQPTLKTSTRSVIDQLGDSCLTVGEC